MPGIESQAKSSSVKQQTKQRLRNRLNFCELLWFLQLLRFCCQQPCKVSRDVDPVGKARLLGFLFRCHRNASKVVESGYWRAQDEPTSGQGFRSRVRADRSPWFDQGKPASVLPLPAPAAGCQPAGSSTMLVAIRRVEFGPRRDHREIGDRRSWAILCSRASAVDG